MSHWLSAWVLKFPVQLPGKKKAGDFDLGAGRTFVALRIDAAAMLKSPGRRNQ